jgi:hypothetical protein
MQNKSGGDHLSEVFSSTFLNIAQKAWYTLLVKTVVMRVLQEIGDFATSGK